MIRAVGGQRLGDRGLRRRGRAGVREHPDAAEQRGGALGPQAFGGLIRSGVLRRAAACRAPDAQRLARISGQNGKFVPAAVAVERQQRLCLIQLLLAPAVVPRVQQGKPDAAERDQRARRADQNLVQPEPADRGQREPGYREDPAQRGRAVFLRRQTVKFPHVVLRLFHESVLVHPGEGRRAGGLFGRGGRFFRLRGSQQGRGLLREGLKRPLLREPGALRSGGVFAVRRLQGSELRVVEALALLLRLGGLQRPQLRLAVRFLLLQLLQLRVQLQIFLMLARKRLQILLHGGNRPLGVRDEAGLVMLDAVLPRLQPLVRGGVADGLVARRDKGGQSRFQTLIRRQPEPRLPDEGAALVHAFRHAQQPFTAVGPGQALDRQAGVGIDGGKHAHRRAGGGGARQGDAAAVLLKLDRALHRFAVPGLVFGLDGQHARLFPLGGIDAVEHGEQEFRPCGLARLVRQLQQVQPVRQR